MRVYIEKNAAERAKLAELAEAGASELPKGVPVEMLSGVTHEDCAKFAQDFGTVLDVEDLIPGAEYTLEVSSPGLERKLFRPEDYTRFKAAWSNSRHLLRSARTGSGKAVYQIFRRHIDDRPLCGKAEGQSKEGRDRIDRRHALTNVEKANLVAEIKQR